MLDPQEMAGAEGHGCPLVRFQPSLAKAGGRGKLRPRALARELAARNRKLPEHKRLSAFVLVEDSFPRTASTKLKREPLAAVLREHVTPGAPGWHPIERGTSAPGSTVSL